MSTQSTDFLFDPNSQLEFCPRCGMYRKDWLGKEGFMREDLEYCCQGCAENTGCTCIHTPLPS